MNNLTREQIEELRTLHGLNLAVHAEPFNALCDMALQRAEARKDAERYRWLRDKSPGQNEQPIVVTQARSGYHMKYIGPLAYADLDAAIDTALKEKP